MPFDYIIKFLTDLLIIKPRHDKLENGSIDRIIK